MNYPAILNVEDVIESAKTIAAGIRTPDGGQRWVPARALGFASWRYRWRAAWLVFTGRADALTWPGQ